MDHPHNFEIKLEIKLGSQKVDLLYNIDIKKDMKQVFNEVHDFLVGMPTENKIEHHEEESEEDYNQNQYPSSWFPKKKKKQDDSEMISVEDLPF